MTPQEHRDRARQLLAHAEGGRASLQQSSWFAMWAMAHLQMADVEERATPENVEPLYCDGCGMFEESCTCTPCPRCGGREFIATGMYQYPCPDCTPENVECRTCGGSGVKRNLNQRWKEICPDCTPENVEEPT